MKTIKQHPIVFLLIGFFVLLIALNAYSALTSTYDTATPGGGDDPREADNRMREIKAAVQERMNDHNGEADEGDHYWPLTGTEVSDDDSGQHRMVTLRQLTVNPSALTSYATTTDLGFLYQKNVTGNGELFWQDEADNVIQLTSGGTLFGNTITGNVAIIGTLDVGGNVDITTGTLTLSNGGAFVTEFSTDGTFGGNSASAVPTEQAVVTYVASENLVKAYGSVQGSNGAFGGGAGASSGRDATGIYTITFDTAFSDIYYAITANTTNEENHRICLITNKLVGSCKVRIVNSSDAEVDETFNFIAVGTQ